MIGHGRRGARRLKLRPPKGWERFFWPDGGPENNKLREGEAAPGLKPDQTNVADTGLKSRSTGEPNGAAGTVLQGRVERRNRRIRFFAPSLKPQPVGGNSYPLRRVAGMSVEENRKARRKARLSRDEDMRRGESGQVSDEAGW